jgi:hypothetical protein
MKWLSAGLTFVNFATLSGLVLGIIFRGLSEPIALVSLLVGTAAAMAAYFTSGERSVRVETQDPKNQPAEELSKRALRRLEKLAAAAKPVSNISYRSFWFWFLAACFAIFAFRSFCWLLYPSSQEELKIQSPNNLGDLALHITFIKNFAHGVPLWPDNPIYVFSKLRYPAGIDLFNALLTCVHVDLTRGLIWTGLLASLATFYAFYRWGGVFGIAGFLFNGGVAGFEFIWKHEWIDYQSKEIAWKSIPLAMFVTQRGLLYAIPAGLLLLWHWREKFFRHNVVAGVADPGNADRPRRRRLQPLPFWIELSLYASMPLFHLHSFIALSIVLLFLFAFGDAAIRRHTATLVASAFLPALFFVWLTTDHFKAGSVLAFKPGLLENTAEFARPFFLFWPINLGAWLPLAVFLIGFCTWRAFHSELGWSAKLPENLSFLLPASVIFVISDFVKLAPWEWDNLKIMIWAYFLVLPFLWSDLIAKWTLPIRAAACFALFASGFISLFGGLAAGRSGFTFANRAELDAVGVGISKIPIEARFAAYPIYNHPLLLQGRKVVLGYPGHLWTMGFDYKNLYAELGELMRGEGDWRATARHLQVRYIFWGNEEKMNYSDSTRPWEKTAVLVSSGNWGAIYDLEPAPEPNAPRTFNPNSLPQSTP